MTTRDALGDRMKEQYENRTRYLLPRRTFTIIRLDGRSFHNYTRGLDRPYSPLLMDDLAETAVFLCEQIQGTCFAYLQSDEISLLLTDFETTKTQAWFDGNLQKIVSISASLATARFNELRPGKLACFDSRAFTIPDPVEVGNYFVWRQKDATRNSITMAAQAYFSHRELHGKSCGEMQDMLWSKGVNWNDYDPRFKRGTVITPVRSLGSVSYVNKRTGESQVAENVVRRVWVPGPAPIFTRSPEFIPDLLKKPRP